MPGLKKNSDARRDIFISYRRDGGDSFARILDDKLERASYSVFFDVEDMRSGKFNEKLYFFVENCVDFLLVLPKDGLDRCKDPNDWVRLEIECALANKKNIIPITLRGFNWPDQETLPESMRELPNYQALEASPTYFDASMSRLAKMLDSKPKKQKRLLTVLVILAICVFGTLITKRLLFPDPILNKNIALGVPETTQTDHSITIKAPPYVKGLIKGSVIDKATREILSIPSGDLLLKDVERIEEIDLSWLSLTDIEELSELTGLKKLDLHNNQISDLSPIAGLIGLESLLIYNNHITSLQPLSGLTNLTELSAENNLITNVSPLAGLTTLKKLFLQNNQIVDVSPIRSLINLTHLALDNNPISDFTPLRIFDTTVFKIPQK